MGSIKDEDVQNDLKKKSKKKKKRKSDSLGEELSYIESGDDSRKKRLKVLGNDTLGAVADVGCNLGACDGSKEETKETGKGKRERKKKKNKIGDERGASPAEGVNRDGSKEEKNDTRKGTMKKEANNGKREKTEKRNEVRDEKSALKAESVSEKIQPMEDIKERKKMKKKKDMLRDGSLSKEVVNDSNVPSTSCGESNKGRGSKRKQRSNPIEPSDSSTPSKKLKKVRFSDQVEFLSLADNSRGTERLKDHSNEKKKGNGLRRVKRVLKQPNRTVKISAVRSQKDNLPIKKVDDGLIRGKRFSQEEDEIVKTSILSYIENHQLGKKGLEMVMKCGLYPELRDCWREIGKALPWRPPMSIRNRAHVLFERNESNSWTPEEIELVNNLRKTYGQDWKALAEKLSNKRAHLKCPNIIKRGQLTSPMVAEGIWADADDYRLAIALEELDAACQEDVDWENLLEHRSGDLCRKRWNQMVRDIGEHGTKSFAEQVEVLSKRYCPDVLDSR